MSVVQKAAKVLFKDIQIEAAPLGKISEENPKHKKIKNPSFEKAKRLDANGKREEAANHCQADALFGLALCDWLENRKDEALEFAKKAIDLNPNLLKRGYI